MPWRREAPRKTSKVSRVNKVAGPTGEARDSVLPAPVGPARRSSSIFLIASLSERLSDAYQIAVWIDDGKLPHPPRLVIEGVLTRDASSGQLCQNKCPVNALHV